MEDSSDAIVEERMELVASSGSEHYQLKMAHFIKPSIGIGSIDEAQVANIPRDCLSSLPTNFDPKKWPLEVKFLGWRYPSKKWKTWVVRMASQHEPTWRKAGIFEAIMNSTSTIRRNNDLVFGVAEKWCHETKSFIFSWGEATITLEDVKILGGFSVLGSPFFHPVETEEMEEIMEKLDNSRKEISKGTSKKASQYIWMEKFMNSGNTIEHEAFLAMWLSRFVIPSSYDIVAKSVIPIAVHLASGTRIALAPAVLAKIYRDLGSLKQCIVASANLESNHAALPLTLRSPFLLVQVWVWERFLDLKPKPNLIENGKPRLAIWDGLNCKVQDVRSVLDTAMGRFNWRPYLTKFTNCDTAKHYVDKAMWISIDSSSDDELLSYARCLRASELVGLECSEQYLPHRVALQFGMDQDIPGCVSRSAAHGCEIAWTCVGKLYIPSKDFEAGFTKRYVEWWKQSMLSLKQTGKDVKEEQKSFTNFETTDVLKGKGSINGDKVTPLVPPSFPPKCNHEDVVIPLVPPGFPPKCIHEDKVIPLVPPGFPPKPVAEDKLKLINDDSMDSDKDQLTIAEMLKAHSMHDDADCIYAGEGKCSTGQCQSSSSSNVLVEVPNCKGLMPTEAASKGSKRATIQETVESNAGRTSGSPDDKGSKIKSYADELLRLDYLESRISRLERVYAEIKEAREIKSMVSQSLNHYSD